MMECPDHLISTIQEDIDRFIFRTNKSPWMAEDRRYLPPNEGGMGAINSWFKRINTGLWSDILRAKVGNLENACFIKPRDIHKMHISISPIVKAFECLNTKFIEQGSPKVKMNTPLDQLPLIKTKARKSGKLKYSNPTRTTHPFLYKKGKICELTGNQLTHPGTHPDYKPKLKSNEDLYEILGISNQHFLRRAEIIRNLKPLIRILTEDKTFKKNDENDSLPKMFKSVKKGSQKYKMILLKSINTDSAPKRKIGKDWKISEKNERERFFEKAFSFWKWSFLPAKIQLILLKICNHNLKLNSQLKHFARDQEGNRVKPECTFCILSNEDTPSEESYRHFFLNCKHSRNTFVPIATKYNIPIPNTDSKGELILYYFPWENYWDD